MVDEVQIPVSTCGREGARPKRSELPNRLPAERNGSFQGPGASTAAEVCSAGPYLPVRLAGAWTLASTVPSGLSWVVTAGGRGARSWGPGGGEGAVRQVGEGGQADLSRWRSGNGAWGSSGRPLPHGCLWRLCDSWARAGSNREFCSLPPLPAREAVSGQPPATLLSWHRVTGAAGWGGALRLPSAPGPAGLGWRSVSSPTPRRGPKSGTASCRGGGGGRCPPRPEATGAPPRRRPVPSPHYAPRGGASLPGCF